MTLAPGTRLGPYEVLGPLGAGGMGEVYRARDDKLGRQVAIKVLPEQLSSDPAARQRFEREARAVAALSHPNILAIFDFGADGGVSYAVTELLDGETLRAKLTGGALPTRRAVELGMEIARALAAAHERQIVHRDVKPENVFVTRDGRVKLLDFGLAKETRQPAAGDTNAPTLAQATDAGIVVGTAGYMSPEQVRGLPLDARTDVFSLGVVLYEMLTGGRPFGGGTNAETMTAILREDPPPIVTPLAPALANVVRRCLEKDPGQRFHSAADVAFALEAVSTATSSTTAPAAALPRAAGRRRLAAAGATVLALAAVAAAFVLGRASARRPEPTMRRLTFRRGFVSSARFAPDGETVVYSAGWGAEPFQIYTTRLDGLESRPLDLPPAVLCSLSRSGEMAVLLGPRRFSMNPGVLARAPLSGGAPREVWRGVLSADWIPGEDAFALARAGKRTTLEFPAGKTVFESDDLIFMVRVSPDGKLVAFTESSDLGYRISVIDRTGKKRSLSDWTRATNGIAWSPDGRELWYAATDATRPPSLWASDLAGQTRLLMSGGAAFMLADVAPRGRALITSVTWYAEMIYESAESPPRSLAWLDWSIVRGVSRDGTAVLFEESRAGGGSNGAAYLRRVDAPAAVRLGDGYALALSPDAEYALSLRRHLTPPELVVWPTGAGAPLALRPPGLTISGAAFVPGTNRLLVEAREGQAPPRLYVVERSEPPSVHPLSSEELYLGPISPDGQWVAAGTQDGVVLVPLGGGNTRKLPRMNAIAFNEDASGLYTTSPPRELPVKLELFDIKSGARRLVKELGLADPSGGRIGPVCVTPDGRTVVYSVQRHLSDLHLVEGLE